MHQRRKIVLAAGMACLLTSCSGPPSYPTTPSLVEELHTPGACYARVYDAAHLAAHPNQTVTRFFLGDPGEAWRATRSPGQFSVAFGFQVVDRQEIYSGVGICEARGAGASCDIEGDGGSFTIEPDGEDLRIVAARIEVEGPSDFSPDLALADNRVMLLRRAQTSECPTP
jgi:hypothetical protein